MSLPADHQQRQQALDITNSYCVSAPAGSGKTELLSQRILKLLANSEKPEEVLAITFTRKAASEMRSRIVMALEQAAAKTPVSGHQQLTRQLAEAVLQQDRQLGWQLLDNPSRLRVQTIDGLCGSLARQMPLMTRFGTSPTITDDAEPSYRQAITRLLNSQIDAEEDVSKAMRALLWHLDNKVDRYYDLLLGLLARRDQWLGVVSQSMSVDGNIVQLNGFLALWVNNQLAQLTKKLQPFASDLAQMADYAASQLADQSSISALLGIDQLPGVELGDVEQWQAIAQLLLTGEKFRKKLDKRLGFPAKDKSLGDEINGLRVERKQQMTELICAIAEQGDVLPLLVGLRYLPGQGFAQQQGEILQAISTVLIHLSAHLDIVFSEQGEVDYTAISMAASRALGSLDEPTDVALCWDYTTRHILIDEFQDTSNSQYELLQKLINQWHEENHINPNRPKTLFLVGDGMQSIYAFREANVGLFLQAKTSGVGDLPLIPLELTVNFRSSAGIVEWNNTVFDQSFPPVDNISQGAVCYNPSVAFSDHKNPDAGQVFGFVEQSGRGQETAKVVDICRRQTSIDNHTVAVLVRNRSHLAEIIPALQAAGIEWQATDIHPLAKQGLIQDLLSLTLALHNSADTVSWLALLRSPLCGLTLAELLLIANIKNENKCSVYRALEILVNEESSVESEGAAALYQRLFTVFDELKLALDNRLRKPTRLWLESVWIALGGVDGLADSHQYSQAERYLDLVEILAANESGLDTDVLQAQVIKLYDQPQTSHPNAVQLMTIHKSKGLEFDTVILPGLDRQPRSDDRPLFSWQQRILDSGDSGLLVAPLAAEGDEQDAIYAMLAYEAKTKLSLEKTRLLYVATTRAVSQLFVLANIKMDDKTERPKPPSSTSLLASVWQAVAGTLELSSVLDSAITEDRPQPGVLLRRLSCGWQKPRLLQNDLLQDYRQDPMRGKHETSAELEDNSTARHSGTVIHEYLEIICLQGRQQWSSQRLSQCQSAVGCRLKELGVRAADVALASTRIIEHLSALLSSELGRWVLDNHYQENHCEWALQVVEGNKFSKLIIDRSFVDDDGCRWIIDYKSAAPATDQRIEAFIEEQQSLYRQQLLRYQTAVSSLQKQLKQSFPIRIALFFITINQLVTFD
ncbi:ATP-dependent helicase/nuclease subunit A [Sinobacterium norvegicum]|uniref:DNA 3'-5' helicase n=1 Tax=Sinobacterium norvegicum TaxID=1641715 RepID=A0ABM9ABD9_9GAMM|nr:UvrD-helicase domain-containing protein [Sinobacterium norvegicum]CAH0990264.1 ATP-dependent helicase/nuclease subunit A [Sinobacterium norvegicum]